MTHAVVFRPLQSRFLTVPQTPVCYWLRDRFFELLAGRTLGDVLEVREGITTSDNNRFIRFHWEQCSNCNAREFLPLPKGGAYCKWAGLERWSLDWRDKGARLLAIGKATLRNLQYWRRGGWTYTQMARGAMGVREIDRCCALEHKGPGVFEKPGAYLPAAVLNSAVISYALRVLNQSLEFRTSSVELAPLPRSLPESLSAITFACTSLKRRLVALDPIERSFGGLPVCRASLAEGWRSLANEADAVAAVLHTLEALSEREVFSAYGIAGDDLQAVLDETGAPAGWFPLIAGYDQNPLLPSGLEIPVGLLEPLAREPRRTLAAGDLDGIKRKLRALYEAGPGAKAEADEGAAEADDDEEEDEAATSGARIPIPTETFLEELSQKLEIHPISVYWLLRELRNNDGVVSKPELVRFVEDYLSVTVLRLLGHQWPREVEGREPLPTWADRDGIIPLTEGTSEPTLLARVRARLAEDFGADRAGAVERELHEITGKSLALWLASDFFKRHISQFKKRPIAWQLTSTPAGNNGKRRGRLAPQRAPAFGCLVYYHRLDADLLPKLRTQYIGPLRTSLQTELGALEKLPKRSADQDARRLELEGKLEELKAFDARLEQVIALGFASPALARVAAKEPLDEWTSRDGRACSPDTPDAFLAQERRYDPDLSDGVRVNIAPLQRASLLAADVLATKDVEKAIADRAEWRADERRWCREGKLPQPGWWREDAA